MKLIALVPEAKIGTNKKKVVNVLPLTHAILHQEMK